MTCQSDGLARVCARVTQGFVQGFSRSFLRLCKGCNGSAHPCLTYMRAHARLRMRVGLHETLATLATLANSKPISLFINPLVDHHCARVAQGLAYVCKGSPENTYDRTCECPLVPFNRAGGMCSAACGSACCGCDGADERCGVNPASRLRAGDRGRVDAAGCDGSAGSADWCGAGRGNDAPLIALGHAAGPFRAVATIGVLLGAAFRCSNPLPLYELGELNCSRGGVW